MQKRKKLSILVLLTFVVSIVMGFGATASAAQLNDLTGHWAKTQIESLVDKGIVTGYPDNTFKPDNQITRAEFMVMTNKAFSFTESTAATFTDVKASDWFAADVAKAAAAGYVKGYPDGTMKPNSKITREEAAVMIATAAKLDTAAATDALTFADASQITWSAKYVAAMVKAGYLKGYPDNTFKAANSITRAEAAQVLSAALGIAPVTPVAVSTFDKAGTYGPATGTETIDGNVTISADGVILQNTTVKGDLLIAEAVGAGNVTLKNVIVTGTTTIKGGGENSVTFDSCTLAKVIANKADGKLRVVLSGTTKVAEFVADAGVNVVGTVAVTKATINVAGVTFQTAPSDYTVKAGVTATIAGKSVTGTTTSSGGGGTDTGSTSCISVANASQLNSALVGIKSTINITSDIGSVATPDNIAIGRAVTINGGGKTLYGNVTINQSGVVINNLTIHGNLIAGAGIAEGNLTLNGVTVTGTSEFSGGGANSVNLLGSTQLQGAVTLNKAGLRLNVGSSAVRLGAVQILYPVIIETPATLSTADSALIFTSITVPTTAAAHFTANDSLTIRGVVPVIVVNVAITIINEGTLASIAPATGITVALVSATVVPNSGAGTLVAKVAAPEISPATGTVADGATVTITSDTNDALIYYTLDGSTPDNTKTAYTAPFTLNYGSNAQIVLKAIAIKTSMVNSNVTTVTYTKPVTTVTITAIDNQTVSVDGTKTVTVSVNPTDAVVAAQSSDLSKATVAVSGNVITITGVAAGTSTITVNATKTGLTAATPVTFTVTVSTGPTGIWSVAPTYAGAMTSEFGVSVTELTGATHFELWSTSGTGNIIGVRKLITGETVRTVTMALGDPSILEVKFFASADATTPVATAMVGGSAGATSGSLTIILPVQPTGTWTVAPTYAGAMTSEFGVSVSDLTGATHFELWSTSGTGNIIGVRKLITGESVRTVTMALGDPSILQVKFFESADATTPVGTASVGGSAGATSGSLSF